MVFWLAILAGAGFAWFAIKIGFYETWVMLFNIVISIYLAVFLSPVILDVVPTAGDTLYSNALAVMTTAIGAFLILHGISYVFFTSQFSIAFPKVFDILVAGFLGFLAGFLVWSFVSFLVYLTPISQNTLVKEMGFDNQQANISYISWWCDLVNRVVSRRDNERTAKEVISGLLNKGVEKKPPTETNNQAEPNKPTEPIDAETNTSQRIQLGTQPEVGSFFFPLITYRLAKLGSLLWNISLPSIPKKNSV